MKFYTAKEIAELLKVHPTTIIREYQRGNLNGFMVGNELRVIDQEFDDYCKIRERQKTSREIQLENELAAMKMELDKRNEIINMIKNELLKLF